MTLQSKTTQFSSILDNLKTGKLAEIEQCAKAIFEPVLQGKVSNIEQHGTFAIQFLHGSFSVISSGNLTLGLLNAVELSYRCFKQARNQIKLTEPLAVPKLLYHIVTKIPSNGFQSSVISLCTYLYEELLPLSEGKNDMVATIISNTFSRLWNLSVKQEQDGTSEDWQILCLRHAVLKILLLKPDTVNSVVDKFILALTRFEKITVQKQTTIGESGCMVVDLVADFLITIQNMDLSVEEELSPIKILQFLLKFGTQYDIRKSLELSLLSINSLTDKPFKHKSVCDLMKVFYFCSQQVLQWIKNKGKENSFSDFNGKKKVSNGKLAVTTGVLPKTIESISLDCRNYVIDALLALTRFIDRGNLPCGAVTTLLPTLCKIDDMLVQWNVTEEKVEKSIMELVQTQVKIIFKYVKSSDNEEFTMCVQIFETLTEVYNKLLIKPVAKDQDRHYCGYVMSKLGQLCSEKNHLQKAIVFYRTACEQLSLFVSSDNSQKQSRIEEVCLGRKYVCLAETYLKNEDIPSAMETLVSCVMYDPSHLVQAIKLWVRIKKDLLKKDNTDMIERTLGKDVNLRDGSADVCLLLRAEFDILKSTRKRYFQAEVKILQQLISASNEPVVKARALLELALVYWQSGIKSTLDVLGFLNQSESVVNNIQGSAEVKGHVYLWQFIIGQESMSQQILSSINEVVETATAEPGEEAETVVTDTSNVFMTVTKEMEAVEMLDKAVALWETLDDINDVPMFLQSLIICSRQYELLQKPQECLQVIQMYHKVIEKYSVTAASDALSQLVDALLSMDLVSEAENLVHNDWDKQTWNESVIYNQIARSHVQMYCNQFEKGISILRDVLALISPQSKTWTVLMLEGKAKRLMSQLLTFPDISIEDYSLDYAHEAVRFHTGVVHFLLGKDFISSEIDTKKGNTIDRWTALTEVLQSLLNLGNLYSHIGEAREAKCYLKEGWKIARYFGLPTWNIQFATEIARLNCICDRGEDAVKSLREIADVLPSVNGEPRILADVMVPECVEHVLADKLCNFCQDNAEQVLVLIPMIAEVLVIQGEEKEAIKLLERSEAVMHKLMWPESGTKKRKATRDHFTNHKTKALYVEILTYLVELSLPLDMKKCQSLLAKGDNLEQLETIPFNTLSRFRLCQSLCTINWQTFVPASANMDITESTKEIESQKRIVDSEMSTNDDADDFMNALPVINLAKKFESMTVKSSKEDESDLNLEKDNESKSRKESIAFNESKSRKESITFNESKSRKESIAFENDPGSEDITVAVKGKRNSRNKRSKSNSGTAIDRTELNEVDNRTKEKGEVKGKRSLKSSDENLLSDVPMQTPAKIQPKLAMKTPRSVCSRKALLDKLMDSDDEDDIKVTVSTRKTKNTARKGKTTQSKEADVYQFDDDNSEVKKSKKSKSVRGQKKLFDTENQEGSEKVVKVRNARSRAKVNTCGADLEMARLTADIDDGDEEGDSKEKKGVKGSKIPRPSGQSAKNMKNNDEVSCNDEECENVPKNQKNKKNSSTAIKKNETKVPVTKTRRMPRSKVEGTEKTRSDSESEDEKEFGLDDSISVKDDESAQSEMMDGYLLDDSSFTVHIQPHVEDFENVVIHEVTESDVPVSLNESIETLRADDKAGKTTTRKGRGQKKVSKNDNSDDQASGETTEVLRSSKLLKRPQIKMEKLVKVEAPRKHDSNTGTVDNHLIQTLEKAYTQSKHLPSPPVFTSICHMLAIQYMELCPLKAAFYLAESIAVTFRHQCLINAARKIRKSNKAGDQSDSNNMEATSVEDLQKSRDILHFNKTEEDFKSMMSQIPDGWSVCQLSVVTQSTPSMLVVSRVDSSGTPIVVQLPGFRSEQGRELLEEFSAIINESRDSMKITDKNEWWRWRRSLDARMQALLENMEKVWLGRWKFLMLGSLVNCDADELKKVTQNIMKRFSDLTDRPINSAVIKVLLQSANTLTDDQLLQILTDLSGCDCVSDIVKEVTQFWNINMHIVAKRHHVVLLLDKTLQHLPWENLPVLKRHSLSRLPSLYHMVNYLSQQRGVATEKVGVTTINHHNVYYVLNPDNNLPTTQETFQDWFEKLPGWTGIVGKPPSASQYKAALTQHDLLVYCGHGSGSKYLNGDDLQQLQCRAAVFLMGCSSGQLLTKGQLEASGMMLNYFLANCPCIVSNLWDVTDKDIDRFLEHLLQSCLSDKPCDVLSEIPSVREACRLPYLIGAAPVVYGFPIVTKNVS